MICVVDAGGFAVVIPIAAEGALGAHGQPFVLLFLGGEVNSQGAIAKYQAVRGEDLNNFAGEDDLARAGPAAPQRRAPPNRYCN